MKLPGWVTKGVLALAPLAAVAAACGSSGGSSDGAQTRTVQVDYRSDEAATSMFEYFPRQVRVRPGDTVEFKQAWTGEPHSVTMGGFVDEKIKPIVDLLDRVRKAGKLPEGEPEEFVTFFEALPFAIDEVTAQNAAQPCYVDAAGFDGRYPGDEKTPCPQRPQPEFNGQAIYSSGIIPYEGVKGNTFEVKLADDLRPGTYTFYCNVHGPLQTGQIVVQEKGTEIPSRSEVARQAREEAKRKTAPLIANFEKAKAGRVVEGGEAGEIRIDAARSNLIGVPTPFFAGNEFIHGIVNEFVPRDVEAKVGQKVTWTFIGGHTISFNVPSYFPVFTVAKDGTVEYNPQARNPVGGWPARPEPEGGGDGDGPPEPVQVDVGPWDGQGFKSTGLGYSDNDTFSVTFTRPGTYPYACLVHPQMVGKLVVKG